MFDTTSTRAPRTRSPWLVLALVVACGKVDKPLTDAAPPDAPPDAAVDATIDAPPVTDRSCTEVKARLSTATDGVYPIDPDGLGVSYKPFDVFCAEMASASPKEYLELRRTTPPSGTPSSNYATYFSVMVHQEFQCPCGILTMVFTKIRINPVTLVVDVSDRTFAVFTTTTNAACWQTEPGCQNAGYPVIPAYATARSCVTSDTMSGRANVDLRDMAFHVAGVDASMFEPEGFLGAGVATIDTDRKQVDLQGGGDCGGFGAGRGLPLAQDF
jgi:hypothetical protein